jgi:hypothetical protein
MKINSKKSYTRSRVMSGHEPHRIMDMKRQEMLNKLAKKVTEEER